MVIEECPSRSCTTFGMPAASAVQAWVCLKVVEPDVRQHDLAHSTLTERTHDDLVLALALAVWHPGHWQ